MKSLVVAATAVLVSQAVPAVPPALDWVALVTAIGVVIIAAFKAIRGASADSARIAAGYVHKRKDDPPVGGFNDLDRQTLTILATRVEGLTLAMQRKEERQTEVFERMIEILGTLSDKVQ